MRTRILLSFFKIYLIIYGCAVNDINNNSKGCYSNTNAEIISYDGINREYVKYIPDSYDGSAPVPLLLNFHGYGGVASNYIMEADMRFLAESENFIMIYPQGSCLESGSHWNPCQIGGGNKSSSDDLGYIEAVISEISSEYNIDIERIYAAGYSNGAMMAYGLANYKSDLIAAVASVSGAMMDCLGSTSHPMPIIHLHGTYDQDIPYNGNNDWASVQTTLEYWINFNNTNINPTIDVDSDGEIIIEHYVYDQGDNLVSVEHYKFIGGNHVWFSETYNGKTTSELVWNFLSKYDLNGLR